MGPVDARDDRQSTQSWRLHQHLSHHVYAIGLGARSVTVSCQRSPFKQTANEDSTLVMALDDGQVLLAVADGVGGLRGGELASQIALETLERAVLDRDPERPLRASVVDGIELANQQILRSQVAGASTIVVVTIEGTLFRSYHVGDSLALQVSNRGRQKFLTIAHSPVGMAVEAGVLEESAAMHHEQRHLVNNIVGSDAMRIEIGATLELAPRDTLVLASDGLFDNLLPDEIAATIRKGKLPVAHQHLIDAVARRMNHEGGGLPSKADDLGLICFRPFGGHSLPGLQEITERLDA